MAGPEPPVVFRRARRDDLPAVVRLLADDLLGAGRETVSEPLLPAYLQAFDAIESDPNQALAVAQDADGRVVGVLQLTYVPSLTHRGGWRAQIEGVRVAASLRSAGVGERMFEWAIDRARERGCRMVQLTTDRARPDAIRFYERLGFVASHVGMKLSLTP